MKTGSQLPMLGTNGHVVANIETAEVVPYTDALESAESSTSPHLEHWKDIAEIRSEIGGVALHNYNRVCELRTRLYDGSLREDEAVELGLSYGATNTMEGGQEDFERLFACLYTGDNEDYASRSNRAQAIFEIIQEVPVAYQQPSSKLLHAAEFLHEAAELEVDDDKADMLLYGALDVYERIWRDDSVGWEKQYKRQALMHWHGGLSALLARDIANSSDDIDCLEIAEESFVDLQQETIEQIREFARLTLHEDEDDYGCSENDSPSYGTEYVVRNGELFEMFTQISGWYLIREEELFGQYEIRPAKERQDRPLDGIRNNKLEKYAHDAVVVRCSDEGEERTRIQLKACPEERDWESSYVDEVPVVRVKNISRDKLRKKMLRSMRQINGHYRSPKKRATRELRSNIEGFFSEELFESAA